MKMKTYELKIAFSFEFEGKSMRTEAIKWSEFQISNFQKGKWLQNKY